MNHYAGLFDTIIDASNAVLLEQMNPKYVSDFISIPHF